MSEIHKETASAPKTETANKRELVSKDKLLEAGVYFGHKTDKWNPKMKPYILTAKKGTHVIDIDKTKRTLEFAYSLIKKYAEKQASFVFVGTRKNAKEAIKSNALRTNSFYVSERWLGGTLTNSKTIFARVKRMFDLEKMAENNFEGYTKKEGVLFAKELAKLQKNLSGIKHMRNKPNVMIVVDPSADEIAVKEARKLGVKVIGIVDTNNDPNSVDVAIPANDDSIKSVTLLVTILADAIVSAKGGQQLFAYQPDEAIVLPDEPVREMAPRRSFGDRPSGDRFRRPEGQQGERREFRPRTDRPAYTPRPAATTTSTTPAHTTTHTAPKAEVKHEAPKAAAKKSLEDHTVAELKEMAAKKNIEVKSTWKKADLIAALS